MIRSVTINDKVYNFTVNSNGSFVGYCGGRMVFSGYSSSYDNAVKSVNDYIDNLLGKTVVEEKTTVTPTVEETKVEEVVAEEAVDGTENVATVVKLEVITEKNEDGTFTVSLPYNVEGAVIKYTINGKDVVSSSKIYREPFIVTEGTIINANVYINKEVVDSVKAYEVK